MAGLLLLLLVLQRFSTLVLILHGTAHVGEQMAAAVATWRLLGLMSRSLLLPGNC
jgi:hypothetical protein